jgi:hypothetical protein
METVIIVQQGGGKNICLNQSTSDIISRSYLSSGDAPFDPAIGGEIRGLSSGDSGELVGFNDIKVFIRPHSSADEFTDTDECFRVAEVEACFVANGADCDQPLQEGDFFCVGDGISSSGCSVTELEHANSMRRMRIMVTLNQPVEEAPIITEAGVADAPELALPSDEPSAEPEEPSEEPAAEPVPEAPPPPDDTFIDNDPPPPEPPPPPPEPPLQVTVPDVFGLTLVEATIIIEGADLFVGNVTTQQAGLRIPSVIRSAHAQACPPGTVITQFPPAGTSVLPETFVDLVLCAQSPPIPEPSSLILFTVGLGLLMLLTWSRRRLR